MPTHIVISGGGTGGHLFPGLAVAEQLRSLEPDVAITFAGTTSPSERRHVEEAGFRHVAMACRAWSTRPWRWPRFVWDHARGFRAAERWLARHKPDVIVGLGGWPSVPMARAAVTWKIPLVLLEQNAVPGRVTRWLASRAQRVCAAMGEAQDRLRIAPERFMVTGNPLRAAFTQAARCEFDTSRRRRLVVLGGSRGSADLNRVVPEALARIKGPLDDWQVVHQTGHAALIETRSRYAAKGRWAWLQPFFSNIAELLASADLVVCRGGGTTLSELAALGVPAIVVPYPHAADDHQLHNARAYAARGACRIVDFRTAGLPAAALACELSDLAMNALARENLATCMRSLARPSAAADVASLVLDEARCLSA